MKTIDAIIYNKPLMIAVLSWALAQLIKFAVEVVKYRKIRPSLFLSTGGMPSSHTSFVTSLATAVGMIEGFNSTMFALSTVLSLVVMTDAAGVRRAAGKHAAAINTIFENTGLTIEEKLKELLGHSPLEVAAGAVLGICTAVFVMMRPI